MSCALNNCSIPQNVLNNLLEYSIPKMKYMGPYFCHFAIIYNCSGKSLKVYSYGYNQLRKGKSIHAEVDAINNLPPVQRRNKKKLLKASLLVIRLSRGVKKLADSKCCMKCCETIFKIPPLRGYTIENVAYSNKNNSIEDHHPISLLLEDDYHLSLYYTKRNYQPKIRNNIISNPDRKTLLFMKKKESDSEVSSTTSD